MSDYRLKIKIGDHEFEAEGPAEVVQQQFAACHLPTNTAGFLVNQAVKRCWWWGLRGRKSLRSGGLDRTRICDLLRVKRNIFIQIACFLHALSAHLPNAYH